MPKPQRNTYKVGRNQSIYADYSTGKYTIRKLASIYKLTPQRVHYLIHDFLKRGYDYDLKTEATDQERIVLKQKALELRENGKYEIALALFQKLITYEETHKLYTELVDTLGQAVVASNKLAKTNIDYAEASKTYLYKMLEVRKKAKLSTKQKKDININIATTNIYLFKYGDQKDGYLLDESLLLVEEALTNYPKPEIQLVWPLIIKARLAFLKKDYKGALDIADYAEKLFRKTSNFKFYEKDDVWKMKLITWLCMLHITYAFIYKDMGNRVLALDHANAILAAQAPLTDLVELKKEARAIVKELTSI